MNGAGSLDVLTTPSPCCASRRARPAPPARTAPPSVPALAMRKRRRVHSGLSVAEPGPGEPPIAADCTVIACDASGRAGGASAPADGAPREPAGAPGASESRTRRATRPAATARPAATTAKSGETSGCLAAATAATSPNATKIAAPARSRRAATTPATAAIAAATRTTRTLRASLSLVPNRAIITSFAPGGWRAIARVPTAMTSDGTPGTSPATSSDEAMATPRGECAGERRRPRDRAPARERCAHAATVP